MRHGGAFELRFMNWIFSTGAANSRAALADPALKAALTENGRRIREHADNLPVRPGTTPLKVVPEYESWLVEAMRSGPESPFWKAKGMSVVDHVADYADVPVHPRHRLVRLVDPPGRAQLRGARRRRSRAPQRLTIGPWVHGSQGSNVSGEVEFTPDAAIDLLAFRLRWYDRWLKGKSNGVDDDPPVLLYIMGTGDDRKSPAGRLQHGGFWRAEREWPLSRARPTPFYLHGDGTSVEFAAERRARPDDLHLRPAPPGPDDRREHLVEHRPDDQRRLRPASPRRHPRRREPPAPLRAPRRAGLPDRAARRGPGSDRARSS